MVDLHSILLDHKNKKKKGEETTVAQEDPVALPTLSEIPDIFFDKILVDFKLGRPEILVLMGLYRMTYCRPNLHKIYGISPLVSIVEFAKKIEMDPTEVTGSIHKLEQLGFINTVRSGQYFVRKYFTKELDEAFKQSYDDFGI